MPRNVSADALVGLPHLDADQAVVLIRKLISQAGADPLQPLVKKALDRLGQAGDALDQSRPAHARGKGTDSLDAHREVQKCWRAAEQWLSGFTLHDDALDPRIPLARKLYGVLFGEGLKFASAKVEVEWVLSQRKIDAVGNQSLASSFDQLGGGFFWQAILAAHQTEGAAAHLTTAADGKAPSQRERMDDALAAVRGYVVKVMGTVDDDDAASRAHADRLLQPLTDWKAEPHPAAAASAPQAGGSSPQPAKP